MAARKLGLNRKSAFPFSLGITEYTDFNFEKKMVGKGGGGVVHGSRELKSKIHCSW